ncbi:DUF1207 domain-containing protein [uncultured Nitrospira sp.]|uniref:DUF1207 domain-containing protein n=1 Tax=uncultured Nitrospira sp. TaxID=157176 RepID=UPI00314001DC
MTQPLGSPDLDSAVPFPAHRKLRKWTTVIVALLCLHFGWMPPAIAVEDSYIAGYAAAVLQHEFNATNASLIVKDGVVTVYADSLATLDRTKVQTALEGIPGVTRVEIREGMAAEEIPKTPPSDAITQTIPEPESKFLPDGLLFDPLHADPRWPHFSVAYRRVSQGPEPNKTGSANFGETFSIYRDAAPFDGQWEIAFQGGVFSVFDLDASSKDLVNADYTAGLLTSYRTGPFSGFIRVYHQSSHLGDEFILNNQPNRINLSYEEIDLKLSYELFNWFRVYGGGGILVDRDPNTLGRGATQFGAELTSPWTLLSGKIRPVAYGDFQVNERSNWTVNRSIMAGLQFENARIGDRKLQLLMEYYKGASPNGQFYSQRTEWIGIGLHLYY